MGWPRPSSVLYSVLKRVSTWEKKMQKKWALILGASSGFGGASAVALAKEGYHIFGIHLDRQVTMPKVNGIIKKIQNTGHKAVFYNANAADPIKRADILDEIKERLRVLGEIDVARGSGKVCKLLGINLLRNHEESYLAEKRKEFFDPRSNPFTFSI